MIWDAGGHARAKEGTFRGAAWHGPRKGRGSSLARRCGGVSGGLGHGVF
jgi:hypothetical protein